MVVGADRAHVVDRRRRSTTALVAPHADEALPDIELRPIPRRGGSASRLHPRAPKRGPGKQSIYRSRKKRFQGNQQRSKFLPRYARQRVEQEVKWAFGPIGFGAIFPPEPPLETSTATIAEQRAKAELAQLKDQFEEGGLAEAVGRMLVAVIKAKLAIRRRSLMIVGELTGTCVTCRRSRNGFSQSACQTGAIDGVGFGSRSRCPTTSATESGTA